MRRLAIVGIVGVWLSLIASLFGRAGWLLDLFAHFRVQYVVLFAMLAVLTLVLRMWLWAALALFGLIIGAVPMFPYVVRDTQVANVTAGSNFKLVSFNVWFRNPDMQQLAAYMEQSGADAVVLLELTPPQAEELKPLVPTYPHYHIDPSRMGAAVFTRWPVLEAASLPLAKDGAIAARVKLDWQGSPVTVLGVHLNWPLGPRNSQFRNEELAGMVDFAKAQPGPLIVAGDFNLTPWSEYFSDALERSGLHDSAIGFGLSRSWPSQFAPVGMLIDHCLLSRHWRSVDVKIGPDLGSDHLPVVAELEFIK